MCESIAELKEQVSEMEREMGRAKEEQALRLSVSYVYHKRLVRYVPAYNLFYSMYSKKSRGHYNILQWCEHTI